MLDGERVCHARLNIGYFSQKQVDSLDYENSPMGHMRKYYPDVGEGEARRFLAGFDFTGDRVFDVVARFSGGEKARLALALLIFNRPNLLLLDEPTNHLDIQMCEALILALQGYDGAVIVVSHDRYFINSIVDSLWLAHDGRLDHFPGSLEDYQQAVLVQRGALEADRPDRVKKNTRKEKVSSHVVRLEKRINTLLSELKDIEVALARADLYLPECAQELHALQAKHERTKQKLDEAERQWMSKQG